MRGQGSAVMEYLLAKEGAAAVWSKREGAIGRYSVIIGSHAGLIAAMIFENLSRLGLTAPRSYCDARFAGAGSQMRCSTTPIFSPP